MAQATAQIGVTGLGVMGRNLARNFARHGYTVALHNRTTSRTTAIVDQFGHEGNFVPAETAEEFVQALERPRRLVIMVNAGPATDAARSATSRATSGTSPRSSRRTMRARAASGVSASVMAAAARIISATGQNVMPSP